jgi:small subunit ribosomal protein S21
LVQLAEVVVGDNESFESAMRRFMKRVHQDGILAEVRRREHYEKPHVKLQKKEAARRRQSQQTKRPFSRPTSSNTRGRRPSR